jgi:hypothetical protein
MTGEIVGVQRRTVGRAVSARRPDATVMGEVVIYESVKAPNKGHFAPLWGLLPLTYTQFSLSLRVRQL